MDVRWGAGATVGAAVNAAIGDTVGDGITCSWAAGAAQPGSRSRQSSKERNLAMGTQWGNKKYMNMKRMEAALRDASIAG